MFESILPYELFRAVWRHKFMALFIVAIGIGLACGFLLLKKQRFLSEAKIYVRVGRSSITLDPTATTAQTLNMVQTQENEINSIYESVNSLELLEKIVDKHGPARILEMAELPTIANSDDLVNRINPFATYNLKDFAIEHLSKWLNVKIIKKSNVIVLSYTAKDPKLAQEIITDLIAFIQEMHIKSNDQPESLGFFAEETAVSKKLLDEAYTKVREFKNKNGISDLGRQRTILVERIGNLENSLLDVQTQMNTIEKEIEQRQKILANLPTTIESEVVSNSPNTAVEGMRQQLYALRIREKEILAKFEENHPEVVNIRQQLELAEKQLGSETNDPQVKRAINESHRTLQLSQLSQTATMAGLKAKQAALANQIASANAEVANINKLDVDLADLETNRNVCEQNYLTALKKKEESRISRELANEKISNINVQQEPTFSTTPVSPNKNVALGLGILGGVLVALLSCQWAEGNHRKYIAEAPAAAETSTTITAMPSNTIVSDVSTNHGQHNVSPALVTSQAVTVENLVLPNS
jgi:polysaccharide biosynthesis protein PslE